MNSRKVFFQMRRTTLLFVIVFFIALSCEKEIIDSPQEIAVEGSTDYLLTYYFNWEDPNLNWMPYPGDAKINLPWTGSGSLYSTVPDEVLKDRKASEGWSLLYSTFDPVILVYNPYFILYNKYRGLMRIYMYINDSDYGASSYLQTGITVPSSIKMLNFAGVDVVDVASNRTGYHRVEAKPVDGSGAFGELKWYMYEYEIAYDPGIVATTSANPPQMSFYVKSINVAQINLGGTTQSKLTGTIGVAQTTNPFPSAVSGTLKDMGKGAIAAAGINFFDNHKTSETSNSLSINNNIFKSLMSGVKSALSSAQSSLPGAAINLLSAIIKGPSTTAPQSINCNISGEIKLDGSIKYETPVSSTPVSMYLPGITKPDVQGNYYVQGYIPFYNKVLGVFNISKKPTVSKRVTVTKMDDYKTYDHDVYYGLNTSSFSMQFNPEVLSSATISNLTYELVIIPISNWCQSFVGRKESILGSTAYTRKNSVILMRTDHNKAWKPAETVLLRVSFNVVPNNGAPISTIIKTFAVDVNTTYL